MDTEQELRLERAEMRMVRWMCGVSLRERKTNVELRERLGIEKIGDVMRRSRLRWMGDVLRKKEDDWVRKSMTMEVEGSRGRGRPRMTWEKVVERDMKARRAGEEGRRGLCEMESSFMGSKRLTPTIVGKMALKQLLLLLDSFLFYININHWH